MKGSDLFLIGLAIWGIYEIDKNNARTPTASPELYIEFARIWKESVDEVCRTYEPVLTNTIEAPLIQEPTALSVPPDNTAIEASKWLALIQHPVVRVLSDTGYSNTSGGLHQYMLLVSPPMLINFSLIG